MHKSIFDASTDYDMAEFAAANFMTDEQVVEILSELLLLELKGKDTKKFKIVFIDKTTLKVG